jgi:hypothetical protein
MQSGKRRIPGKGWFTILRLYRPLEPSFKICRPCIPSPLVDGVRFVSFYPPRPRLRVLIEISRGRGDFLGFH